MDKPICKVNGMIRPGAMCGLSCASSSGLRRCGSREPEMCKHSSVYDEAQAPNPCSMCQTDDDLYLTHTEEDTWFVICSLCDDTDELEADEGCATKEDAIAAWNIPNE